MNGKGEIVVIDLNDGKSVQASIGLNQAAVQLYNVDTKGYTPDFTVAATNLVATPRVYISGDTQNQMLTDNVIAGSVKWYIDGVLVISSTPGVAVGAAKPFALTLSKNISGSAMLLECEAMYVDPETKEQTVVKAQASLSRLPTAAQVLRAIATADLGNSLDQNTKQLTMTCRMYRGMSEDSTDVSYTFYKLVGGSFVAVTAATAGCTINKNVLTITADAIENFDTFKCVCIDKDANSATYNNEVWDSLTFYDMTDEIHVEVVSSTGGKLSRGMSSMGLTAIVTQGDAILSDTKAADITYTWKKYNKDPNSATTAFTVLDSTWGSTGKGATYQNMTLTRDKVSVAAKITCNVMI